MDRSSSTFSPSAYSDVPLYNIQAVAAATGVPAITLRSWERRYGVPRPKRDPKGYRLYSERDIALTRWLRDRVEHGVGISRAVNMLTVLEQESREVADRRETLDLQSLRARLLDAVRRLDEPAVNQVIAEALMVATVEETCMQVLQPVLYEVGELWATGSISVTTEHVGSNLIRSHVAQLVRISPSPIREDQVVVGCAPGEHHDIGALMLALFLRRRGYDVLYAGANVEAEDFIEDVSRINPEAACLSAGTPRTAHSLARVFEALQQRYAGPLFFGGRAFKEHPELVERVPGIYLAGDAPETVDQIELTLREGRARRGQTAP